MAAGQQDAIRVGDGRADAIAGCEVQPVYVADCLNQQSFADELDRTATTLMPLLVQAPR